MWIYLAVFLFGFACGVLFVVLRVGVDNLLILAGREPKK